MAKFKNTLWTECELSTQPPRQDMLLLATLLWLRTYDRDGPQWLGLENLIKLIVPYNNEFKLGLSVPDLPKDYIVASDGTVTYAPGVPDSVRFVYVSRNFARELDLDVYGALHISYQVHLRWIEWALATAILMLHKAGKPWHRNQHGQFKQTIGGLEVASFLDL